MTKRERTKLRRMLEKVVAPFSSELPKIVGDAFRMEQRVVRIEQKLDELIKLHQPADETLPKEIVLRQDDLRNASLPMLRDLADACKLKLSPEERVSPTLLRAKIERYAQRRGQLLEPKEKLFTKDEIKAGKKAVREAIKGPPFAPPKHMKSSAKIRKEGKRK